MRFRRFLMLLAALSAAVVLAACGGDDAGDTAGATASSISLDGPASLAPAGSPIYIEGSVNPQGDTGQQIKDIVTKVSNGKVSDPGAEIIKQLEKSAAEDDESPKLDFEKDVKPWLGERAGLFVTSFGGAAASRSALGSGQLPKADREDFDGAAIVEVKDQAKAKAFVMKFATDSKTKTYKGVSYRLDNDDDTAVGVVEDYLVVGTEAGLRKATDTAQGAAPISKDDSFDKGVKATSGEVLFGYVDLAATIKASGDENADTLTGLLDGVEAIAFGASVDSDAVKVNAITIGGDSPYYGPGKLIENVPGDSLLALGLGNIKAQGDRLFKQLETIQGGAEITKGLNDIERQTGLDVKDDLLSWMGDGALFVKGDSVSTLGGALVVKSTDTAKTKDALGKLRQLVTAAGSDSGIEVEPVIGVDVDDGFQIKTSEVPFPIQFALKGDTFVIALGNGALSGALQPKSKLADNAAYKTAIGKLSDGTNPALFLDLPAVVKIIDNVAGNDKDYAEIKPYLSAFGAIAAGSQDGDDGTASELVVPIND